MTWARLDDNFPDHPKVDALTDRGFRLHVAGICYCARHLTDGLIPRAMVKRLSGYHNKAVADVLTDHTGRGAVWSETADGDYLIHDYLTYNPSKQQMDAEREAHAERTRRWRARKGGDASRDGHVTETCDGSPSHPIPSTTNYSSSPPPTRNAPRPQPVDNSVVPMRPVLPRTVG